MRTKVAAEIQKLEQEGIIEKVSGPTEGASRIVTPPKPKSPNEIRLCVYMRDASRAIYQTHHPNYRWVHRKTRWRDCLQQAWLKIRVPPVEKFIRHEETSLHSPRTWDCTSTRGLVLASTPPQRFSNIPSRRWLRLFLEYEMLVTTSWIMAETRTNTMRHSTKRFADFTSPASPSIRRNASSFLGNQKRLHVSQHSADGDPRERHSWWQLWEHPTPQERNVPVNRTRRGNRATSASAQYLQT